MKMILNADIRRVADQSSAELVIYSPQGRWLRLAALYDRDQPFSRRGLWRTYFAGLKGLTFRSGPQDGQTLTLLAHYMRHNAMSH